MKALKLAAICLRPEPGEGLFQFVGALDVEPGAAFDGGAAAVSALDVEQDLGGAGVGCEDAVDFLEFLPTVPGHPEGEQ